MHLSHDMLKLTKYQLETKKIKSPPWNFSFTNTLKLCLIYSANTIQNAKLQYKDNCTLLRSREWKVSRLAHYHIFALMARLFILLVSNMNFRTKCWYLFIDSLSLISNFDPKYLENSIFIYMLWNGWLPISNTDLNHTLI